MQIHQIKREHPNKRKKIVGRGGKRGTTSGKGTKGQLARSGRKLRPEFRDLIKKIPKLRGYRFNSIQEKPIVLNISDISVKFNNGDTVSPKTLFENKLISMYKGRMPKIKILGGSELDKKLTIVDCAVSSNTRSAVEKAGGSVK